MRLVITCPDRPGIVAAVAGHLFERGANILDSAQHSTEPWGGRFFMRIEFALPDPEGFEEGFERAVARPFAMRWRVTRDGERKRLAILVSRHDHCLLELLWRLRRNELGADVVQVVSNHPDLEPDVRGFGIPYAVVPVEKGRKPEAEQAMLELLAGRVDLVVLARYMQILSGDFLERIGVPLINIHHSFLPAFAGAEPYRRAFERGVKMIGATAHYVTEELDEGPIIAQDVAPVSHRHGLADFEAIGRDLERVVLAHAVRRHVDDRIVVDENKTFVFE